MDGKSSSHGHIGAPRRAGAVPISPMGVQFLMAQGASAAAIAASTACLLLLFLLAAFLQRTLTTVADPSPLSIHPSYPSWSISILCCQSHWHQATWNTLPLESASGPEKTIPLSHICFFLVVVVVEISSPDLLTPYARFTYPPALPNPFSYLPLLNASLLFLFLPYLLSAAHRKGRRPLSCPGYQGHSPRPKRYQRSLSYNRVSALLLHTRLTLLGLSEKGISNTFLFPCSSGCCSFLPTGVECSFKSLCQPAKTIISTFNLAQTRILSPTNFLHRTLSGL